MARRISNRPTEPLVALRVARCLLGDGWTALKGGRGDYRCSRATRKADEATVDVLR